MDMIQINLLPKEFRKKTGKLTIGKSGYYAIGVTAGVIIMIVAVTFYQMFQLRKLDENMEIASFRTQQLQKDIAVVDALIDVKEKIMQRMEAVDKLDQHRSVWVRILEEFSRQVPDFVWVSAFNEGQPPAPVVDDSTAPAVTPVHINTKPVTIEGFAFTLNSLANFMIKLMRSHYFSEVEMASVEEVLYQEHKAYSYKLSADVHYLSDNELKELLEKESGPDLLASF
jgi:Tfp pilus assembly protein PilN